jgi:hypothetical protein
MAEPYRPDHEVTVLSRQRDHVPSAQVARKDSICHGA